MAAKTVTATTVQITFFDISANQNDRFLLALQLIS